MKNEKQKIKWMLAALFLATLVFSAGQEISAKSAVQVERIISESCQGLANCENEGRILHLQGQPISRVIRGMCSQQMSDSDRSACYNFAYRLAPRLGKSEILKGYEGNFSLPLVKGYLHFVTNTCERIICLAGENSCEVRAVSCWQELSSNPKAKIADIVQSMSAREQG